MIVNQGKEYYPLEFGKMVKDGKTYYDRSSRNKNYFYLVLSGSSPDDNRFIPDGSTGLITADGLIFKVQPGEQPEVTNRLIPDGSSGLLTADGLLFKIQTHI